MSECLSLTKNIFECQLILKKLSENTKLHGIAWMFDRGDASHLAHEECHLALMECRLALLEAEWHPATPRHSYHGGPTPHTFPMHVLHFCIF